MKILKITSLALLSLLLILSPLITTFSVIFCTPKVYKNTIYGELDDKFRLLCETEEKKIIVIGGSSVAFGLDSETLSEHIGKPVVNFGLYAAIGTKAMLELSLAGINEGDTVVLAPELDSQTMSTYFSGEHILPAVDEDYSMLGYFDLDDIMSVLGASFSHAASKWSYKDSPLDPEGIYNSKSFNALGDIKEGLREGNVMQLYYDPTTVISLDESIVAAEFIDYLNSYIKKCERRGATVYFSYCPMNESALAEGTDNESKSSFVGFLEENINCDFISEIDDYIYDKAYFYDTNYHLNDTGVKLRTAHLAQDLLIAEEKFTLVNTEIPPPPLPELDVKYMGAEDENAKYFTYEKMENGAYMITGLSREGMEQTSLTVPLGYDGYKVTAIGKAAFESGNAKSLTVTEDTNLKNFLNGAFDGSKISDIYIFYDYVDAEDKIFPCTHFCGADIHIPKASGYISDYDWLTANGYRFIVD